jgi:hypothetical protein
MLAAMLQRALKHLTYANVMATIAIFLVLGGVSYAAIKLPRNSVGTRQLKAKAVTTSKVNPSAQEALRGQKGEPGERGDSGAPGPAPTSEALRELAPADSSSEPRFATGDGCYWKNFDPGGHSLAGFFKDPWGVVHVKGLVDAEDTAQGDGACHLSPWTGDNIIFYLPAGYRPSRRAVFVSEGGNTTQLQRINVDPTGSVNVEGGGLPQAAMAEEWVTLEGITFPAEQ